LPRETVVPVIRGPLRGARWIAGSANHGFWLGTFEPGKLRAFCEAVRPGDVVYDVGAHVGLYTLLAARRVGPAGHVFAFEPSHRNLAHLHRHCTLNHAANVRIVEAAVSDIDGMLAFAGPNPAMAASPRRGLRPFREPRPFRAAEGRPPADREDGHRGR
jgi:hypothetical protein